MVGLVYIVLPFLLLWLILDLILGKIRGRTAIFMVIMGCITYCICFVLGLLLNFWYEPDSYWQTMMISTTYWDTNAFPPDALLAHCLLIPYIAAITFTQISIYILSTHFSWGFAVSYGCGLICMWNWISAAVSASRIRNPNYGFGDKVEYDKYRKILNKYKST